MSHSYIERNELTAQQELISCSQNPLSILNFLKYPCYKKNVQEDNINHKEQSIAIQSNFKSIPKHPNQLSTPTHLQNPSTPRPSLIPKKPSELSKRSFTFERASQYNKLKTNSFFGDSIRGIINFLNQTQPSNINKPHVKQ